MENKRNSGNKTQSGGVGGLVIMLGAIAIGAGAAWLYGKNEEKKEKAQVIEYEEVKEGEEVKANTYQTPTGPGAPHSELEQTNP